VLANINESMANMLSFHFVTAACALVNRETREAEIALAGHAPPVLFKAATGEVTQEGDGELPLGVSRGTKYAAGTVRLDPGDILVFTTDGITESLDPEDDQYGAERLRDCVLASGCENAAGLLDAILRDVRIHAAGREPNDDQTLLVVRATE
jgi:sigma-B regulation protein RsbU (phosphoserine phosphatase)